jgi:hypothetical protein
MDSGIDTPAQLQSLLSTLLSTELGTFSTGQPAIWVEPPAVPQTLSTTGLQCIIERYDQQNGIGDNLINNQESYTSDWVVILTSYDRTNVGLAKLDTAIDKIRRRFPKNRKRILPFTEDSYPQCTFLLQFYHVKNTIN